ncbi:MAG: hypothetical protein WDW38_006594 [Sanguina aurantia]
MFSHVDTLIHAIHRAARQARTLPPPPHFPVPWEPCVLSEGAPRPPFAYESLESLWDPNLRRSAIGRLGMGVPLPLPRATYEQDDEHWVRVPLPSDGVQRGILQLACLVHDSSLHVYDDFSKVAHTNRFAARVDEELTRRLVLAARDASRGARASHGEHPQHGLHGDARRPARTHLHRPGDGRGSVAGRVQRRARLPCGVHEGIPTHRAVRLARVRPRDDTWAVRVSRSTRWPKVGTWCSGCRLPLRAVRQGRGNRCSYTTLKARVAAPPSGSRVTATELGSLRT